MPLCITGNSIDVGKSLHSSTLFPNNLIQLIKVTDKAIATNYRQALLQRQDMKSTEKCNSIYRYQDKYDPSYYASVPEYYQQKNA
jgi:hypothetical protein